MRIKLLGIVIAFLLVQGSVVGQGSEKGSDGFFFDTLVIMDYTSNLASERLTRSRNPMKRNFYLKSADATYPLFKGQVINLTAEQIITTMNDGFSLFIDKGEHQDHKNLKPSILEIIGEDGKVIETIENLGGVKDKALWNKLSKVSMVRISGFIISVNEEKLGPIQLDFKVIE